jgi:hypothetical protein
MYIIMLLFTYSAAVYINCAGIFGIHVCNAVLYLQFIQILLVSTALNNNVKYSSTNILLTIYTFFQLWLWFQLLILQSSTDEIYKECREEEAAKKTKTTKRKRGNSENVYFSIPKKSSTLDLPLRRSIRNLGKESTSYTDMVQ